VTDTTDWDETNHIEERVVQTAINVQPPTPSEATVAQSESRGSSLTMPSQSNVSEGNVQGFLDQAARADREKNRPTSLEDNDDDLPFDNNNEDTPF
jgi:hypothetical protein